MMDLSFYRGRNVFITGHTGFKGAWLSHLLLNEGANVTGFSLEPPTDPNLYSIINLNNRMDSNIGDIRDLSLLKKAFESAQPEIVLHLAAQPIVRDSYQKPVYTYETNIMGTIHLLECARESKTVKSFINVTTDKVYRNNEWEWGYRETDTLGGYDPYSNSKSCSELVTQCYKDSFFSLNDKLSISTVRAGNVIGGGDFANNRIIPDCIRAVMGKKKILVRNPFSTRPYQHVLEPLLAYLMVAEKQFLNSNLSGCYNVGPNDRDCITTGNLVDIFCDAWGENVAWENRSLEGPHESNFLKLDCSKIKSVFAWEPRWNIEQAVKKTCEWTKAWMNNENMISIMDQQIDEYKSGVDK